jgi:trans-aconitate methyltransferase
MKAKGKSRPHISAAGKWLRFRGHLENISGNLFLGVINAFRDDVEAGHGKDPLDGSIKTFPDIAAHLHAEGVSWCAVGDENYGEGSSREHAAMEPRFRNGKVIFARSFARIHETNAKKQGLLPLTFSDPATYDEIGEDDRISVHDLAALAPDVPVRATIHKPDGSTVDFECTHTFSPEQIGVVPGRLCAQHHPGAVGGVTVTADGWDPAQYHRFDAERDRPFFDLLELVQPVDAPALVDLGCGDGRLTVIAHERLGAVSSLGIDSSPAMLDKAPAVDGMTFERGDIAEWSVPDSADVIVANASLHWVGDHGAVLTRWRASLRPGGQLLVNVPANADHPSHRVLAEVTDELGIEAELDPVASNVLLPEAYADVLDRLGADQQHVRLQVYAHHLASSDEVVEW